MFGSERSNRSSLPHQWTDLWIFRIGWVGAIKATAYHQFTTTSYIKDRGLSYSWTVTFHSHSLPSSLSWFRFPLSGTACKGFWMVTCKSEWRRTQGWAFSWNYLWILWIVLGNAEIFHGSWRVTIELRKKWKNGKRWKHSDRTFKTDVGNSKRSRFIFP